MNNIIVMLSPFVSCTTEQIDYKCAFHNIIVCDILYINYISIVQHNYYNHNTLQHYQT